MEHNEAKLIKKIVMDWLNFELQEFNCFHRHNTWLCYQTVEK